MAHAAITVLHRQGESIVGGVHLRWAVFLPLDDAPAPLRSSTIVEAVEPAAGAGAWDIVMHGYFWPSHNRRSIPGVTDDDDDGQGESLIRARWNRAVRDQLTMPLLPRALAHAVNDIPEDVAGKLLEAVAGTETVRKNISYVTTKHVILPVITETGVRWKVYGADGAVVLAIPSWKDSPGTVRTAFVPQTEGAGDVIFIAADAPRIGGEPDAWPARWIKVLLSCVPVDVLRTPQDLIWVERCIYYLLGPQQDGEGDERTAAVARWLAERVGEGALNATTGGPPDTQHELRAVWRRLYQALPAAWLIDAPIESQQAVAELAATGVVGGGLLPVPLGSLTDRSPASRPDPARVDHALLELGRRLANGERASKRAHDSRLVLTGTLLSVRGDLPLADDLARLPLLRALRLPDGRFDAWSVSELRRRTGHHRVFARVNEETAAGDPRQAVQELAEAVGHAFWLVDRVVASTSVPLVENKALADAVLQAEAIRSVPAQRIPLLSRLCPQPGNDADSAPCRALRMLLTGTPDGAHQECDLYDVRAGSERDNNRTLEILLSLRDQKWRAVEHALVAPLRHDLVERLQVHAIDAGTLQRLLGETLDETSDTGWSRLQQTDVLHLLRQLHGTTPEDSARWRAMPLHRGISGDRGVIDDRTLRATGAGQLPPALEAEVRLLEPDSAVEDLYHDVPGLDHDDILRTMLESECPHRFVDDILDALHSDSEKGSQIIQPRDPALRALLRDRPWLPGRSPGTGLAPALVVDLPGELSSLVDSLAGTPGEYRMAKEVVSDTWNTAREVVHEILGRPDPAQQVRRLATALNTDEVAGVDGGRYLILPRPGKVDRELIEDAIQCPLADSHPGWGLIRAAWRSTSGSGRDAVLELARVLCAPVPAQHQVSMLQAVAKARPGKDSAGGRVFRRLVRSFVETDGFFEEVLPCIELPTQDGHWRPAREVARSPFGVARRHRILDEFRSVFELDSDETVAKTITGERQIAPESRPAAVPEHYFERWKGRLNPGAVGAFLSLLGNGRDDDIRTLSQRWLGADVDVKGVRHDLCPEVSWVNVKAFFSGVGHGNQVEAVNVLGNRVVMDADADNKTIFTTEPRRNVSALGEFWTIDLREVNPETRTAQYLTTLLGNTVEKWTHHVMRLDRYKVQEWWKRWGTGSQAQVGPVRASILAHLPLALRQLEVQECAELQEALKKAERAQRKRAQAAVAERHDAMDTESDALERLASLIQEPEHSTFLRGRVRDLMQRFGYGADSVLLELVQNADDALAQAAEIAGRRLPQAARRVVVRVHDHEGRLTVDFKHYGRPINDTGGPSFSAGEDRQWDQDLYFMMLMNLGGKPGETPGQATSSSTTGCFGLGFKSVHLLSESPSIVSGFLAFSIAAGLLPTEQQVPDDPDLTPVDSQRTTRIRLVLRGDVDEQDLIARIFRRFNCTRMLLPAFARELREIVVDGGRYAGISIFEGEQVAGAPGWSLARQMTELPGHGMWRILRFRPGSAENGAGTVALVLGLREGMPEPLPPDLPFLWNVTPTSEGWGCGYAVNGPFKLDPGRTHVSLDHEATLRVADLLGDALGTGLVALHDALDSGVGLASGLPMENGAVTAFVTSLWNVLASGISDPDSLRRRFLLRLHGSGQGLGSGRGLSAWMCARPVVPSGLPAPFRRRLPPLKPDMRIEMAVHDSALCDAFARIEDLARLASRHLVVSGEVAHRLRLLWAKTIRQLHPSDLFRELTTTWDHRLTPERLHALRPLAQNDVWRKIADHTQATRSYSKLVARSVAGTFVRLPDLLLRAESSLNHPDVEDELKHAAFAPDESILDPRYITASEDVTMFLRLREPHRIDAGKMAGWFADLADERRRSALRYLLHGRLHQEVLQRLIPTSKRPTWLGSYDDVRRMLDELNGDSWRRHALLAALFEDRFPAVEPEQPPRPPPRDFFDRLQRWWNKEDVRRLVIKKYERTAWPDWLRQEGIAKGLHDGSRGHWLALLVLGACRGLGRTRDDQHRGFLEMACREGWWEVFRNADEPSAWMQVLRTWQDPAVEALEYRPWMALFPAIYQLSRYLNTYRRLLRSAGRRPTALHDLRYLLAPRADEELTGTGRAFDAPPAPLNMGLHWILRELVRMDILDKADHLLPDCWVPSEQVLSLLRPFGLEVPDGASSHSEKARAVCDFLAPRLTTTTPHLHYAFDIPLRYVDAAEPALRRHLGLES